MPPKLNPVKAKAPTITKNVIKKPPKYKNIIHISLKEQAKSEKRAFKALKQAVEPPPYTAEEADESSVTEWDRWIE
jgi:hypothetical protein